MPVETAADSPESRYPVRRSGRQAKRTDKLEEFLSSAKRGSRKSGEPLLQTPTDAETASEASLDGNPDFKNEEDKEESPERRTRSSARKQQQKSQGGRQTRGGGRVTVKDEESSENEDDDKDAATEDHKGDKKEEECSVNVGDTRRAQSQPEMDSTQSGGVEQKNEHDDENIKEQIKKEAEKDTNQDGTEKTVVGLVKRGPLRTYVNKKKVANKNTSLVKAPASKTTTSIKRETRAKSPQGSGKIQTRQRCNDEEEEEDDEDEEDDDDDDDDDDDSSTSSSSESDSGYDPNALYCICRQKHNKRFMICCDRCEEWFHGDCVGITEARGRLMERNGEDYICPNCTTKKNQLVRPATSNLSASLAIGKPRVGVGPAAASAAVGSVSAEKANSLGDQSPVGAAFSTGAGSDDMGIKGRIEKATNPTGKKKIKIFQPQPLEPKGQKLPVEKKAAEQKPVQDTEPKVASNVEVKTTPTGEAPEEKVVEKPGEEASLPKCIGPGCENDAQPDSVYCGNDCILRHAAAAMKSISDDKEPGQDKVKPEKTKSTPKKSSHGGKKTQKMSSEESGSEEEHSPDPDEEDEHAVEERPPPNTASWSSDHNYIAVAAEKTTPISATVLNRKCMYLFEGLGLLMKPLFSVTVFCDN